ncbi:MAG: prohibitin family protein [Zoogloeaceae bacterium]|jgi:regulator of protease activity HflC (stomatin/prohibitin superfamily)|nr:prohibitin family protein [Zoogloeaceae bacterium]
MEEFDLPNEGEARSRKDKFAQSLNQAAQSIDTEKLANGAKNALRSTAAAIRPFKRSLIAFGIFGLVAYVLTTHLPLQPVPRGETGLRVNQWTGGISRFQEGSVLVIPGVHEMRTFSLRDQVYQPDKSVNTVEFQSVEGLALGVDFSVRYALDPEKIPTMARILPDDISGEVVLPIIHDTFHRNLARYTVREIFSDRRQEIQEHITKELQTRLASEGIKLKLLTIGKVELPDDYKRGMERLLAAEQATEQMRYTLELKDKEVKQSELVALADKVRREKAAEAAGEEQIIAAKAQAEAMKHILPFKEKQIQQRALEAEADKVTRLKNAQANADARRIEAEAEADSRKKLAEAEVFRLEQIGKVNSDQMAREGAILAQSPLLIQKSLADKLSDKISVIIAPPSASGGFIAENIIGRLPAPAASPYANNADDGNEED